MYYCSENEASIVQEERKDYNIFSQNKIYDL